MKHFENTRLAQFTHEEALKVLVETQSIDAAIMFAAALTAVTVHAEYQILLDGKQDPKTSGLNELLEALHSRHITSCDCSGCELGNHLRKVYMSTLTESGMKLSDVKLPTKESKSVVAPSTSTLH